MRWGGGGVHSETQGLRILKLWIIEHWKFKIGKPKFPNFETLELWSPKTLEMFDFHIKTGSFNVSKFQSFKVSKFQSFKVSKFQNSKDWNSKVSKFQSSRKSKVWNSENSKVWNFGNPNFGTLEGAGGVGAGRREAARGGAGRAARRCEAATPSLGARGRHRWGRGQKVSSHQARQAKPAFGSAGRRPALPECLAVLAGVRLITSRDLG